MNESFNEQLKHKFVPDQSDTYGYINIPSKFDFWVVMNEGTIYILSSRRSVLTHVVQQFRMTDIVKDWIDNLGQGHKAIEKSEILENCIQFKV